MITNDGLKVYVNRIGKATPDYTLSSLVSVGVTQATPEFTNTSLTRRVPITQFTIIDECTDNTDWTATTDGETSVNTDSYIWSTASLNLFKSGATETTVVYYNDNYGNQDFTDKDVWCFFYVAQDALDVMATTDSVEFRYGNDHDTNYYSIKMDKADLTVGWNAISFNIAEATEVGTVTVTECDTFAVAITVENTTDVIAEEDVRLDFIFLAEESDYYKTIETDYPVVNENTLEIDQRYQISSVHSVGFLLNGVGFSNTDATKKMTSIFEFSAISKSSDDELAFKVKKRIRRN